MSLQQDVSWLCLAEPLHAFWARVWADGGWPSLLQGESLRPQQPMASKGGPWHIAGSAREHSCNLADCLCQQCMQLSKGEPIAPLGCSSTTSEGPAGLPAWQQALDSSMLVAATCARDIEKHADLCMHLGCLSAKEDHVTEAAQPQLKAQGVTLGADLAPLLLYRT